MKTAERAGIDHKQKDGIPGTFEKRLRTWQDLNQTFYAEIPHYLETATSIFDAALEVSKKRNILVHGFVHGWEPSPAGSITITKIYIRGRKQDIERYQFNLVGLQTMVKITELIDGQLGALRLNREMGTHRIKD